MSPQKNSATMYLQREAVRQEKMQRAIRVAEKAKKEAMRKAQEPMGACLIVAVFLLVAIIAPPVAGVLIWIA